MPREIVMENLAAEGGFRISAKRTAEGQVRDVRVTSTLGGPCHMTNPWPGKTIEVSTENGLSQSVGQDSRPQFIFSTGCQSGDARRPLFLPLAEPRLTREWGQGNGRVVFFIPLLYIPLPVFFAALAPFCSKKGEKETNYEDLGIACDGLGYGHSKCRRHLGIGCDHGDD